MASRGDVRRLAAVLLCVTLPAAAGCSRDPEPVIPSPSTSSTPAPEPFVAAALEPVSLDPADITDRYGDRIARLVYRGLYRFDAKGKPVLDVAKSVDTADDRTFTVTLPENATFSDGEPVTADSFVDAWNSAALPDNALANRGDFAPILGYAQVAAGRTTAMSGLSVVDATTFTITLTRARPSFTADLARLSYSPLPSSALTDRAANAHAPVGNGPYKITKEWQPGVGLTLGVFTGYAGTEEPQNPGITFNFLSSLSDGYEQLRNVSVDVIDEVPLSAVATYRKDLKLRAINQPVGVVQTLAFPMQKAPWNTPVGAGIRRAISRAIDRTTLASQTFAGTRQAATDFTSRVVDGHSTDLCGAVCEYDPTAAAAELPATTATAVPKGIEIAYGVDSDDRAWVTTVCAQVRAALGITCTPRPYPTSAGLAQAAREGTLTTPFVATWTMPTPDLASFLTPRFLPGSPLNLTRYSSRRVAGLLTAATTATDQTAAYHAVETALLADLPEIPLWSVNATGGSSERVQNLSIDAFGRPIYPAIVLSD